MKKISKQNKNHPCNPVIRVIRDSDNKKTLTLISSYLVAVFAAAAMIFSLSGLLQAAEINLPKTGQTGCWDASGSSIACAGTGQDGEKQVGVSMGGARFIDNNNGTITDTLTGLIWLKNANCLEMVGGVDKSGGTLTWANALTWSNNLQNGNCWLTDNSAPGDWRLPNVIELESLVNAQQSNTAAWLNSQGFTNFQSSWYWSSSTSANNTDYAWVAYMNYGFVLRCL